ncbi:iron-sulfur protein I [Schizosaccharomyces japonicus yFS275]|uniref:Iron-sulfur assembly protein 1 n=1 Tax=Schizosaccharomyces japonicus (strain yFS275 / FY16936) TaxID=402676 RepID=B6K4Y6_SCHJY|nr:iron-sulfur protein I [Schizosaccharomyces japonicus yFS275]EEB08543.1 iron-sulfur protein I [Schizosaccharomyces japonicus yFS275]
MVCDTDPARLTIAMLPIRSADLILGKCVHFNVFPKVFRRWISAGELNTLKTYAPKLRSEPISTKSLNGNAKLTRKTSARRFNFPRKNVISITPVAVDKLKELLLSQDKLLRIGVKQKGCAGQSYSFEYVDQPDKFDEIVEQDGVRVIVQRRALLQIIGSSMDFKDDDLQSRFVFSNPNVKSTCGCGESFVTNNP